MLQSEHVIKESGWKTALQGMDFSRGTMYRDTNQSRALQSVAAVLLSAIIEDSIIPVAACHYW